MKCMKTKLALAIAAILFAGTAGAQQQPITLTPATAQALRNNAYNFAACASMVHFRSDAPFKNNAELQEQADRAIRASIELYNWLRLLRLGEAVDPPDSKFTRAQLADNYGVARADEAMADNQRQVQAGGRDYYGRALAYCTNTVFPQALPEALDLLKAAQNPQQP